MYGTHRIRLQYTQYPEINPFLFFFIQNGSSDCGNWRGPLTYYFCFFINCLKLYFDRFVSTYAHNYILVIDNFWTKANSQSGGMFRHSCVTIPVKLYAVSNKCSCSYEVMMKHNSRNPTATILSCSGDRFSEISWIKWVDGRHWSISSLSLMVILALNLFVIPSFLQRIFLWIIADCRFVDKILRSRIQR